jgi:hypothetical protein
LWYACADGTTILVFTNTRIVPNNVWLLDGKNNMAALGLLCSLATGGQNRFICQKRALIYVDEGDHFLLRLASQRVFAQNEKGLAVYRDTADCPLVSHPVCAQQYRPLKALRVGEDDERLPDNFPELDTEAVCAVSKESGYSLRSIWTYAPCSTGLAANNHDVTQV